MEELCTLCGKRARMLCESDQAKLCWDCDQKVHGANFLVAKHLRVLLCRLCQSPTPWKACGPTLTPTSSLCHRCCLLPTPIPTASATQSPNDHDDDDDDGYDDSEEEDDDDDGYDDDDDSEEEEGENQVVPWSSASASPPPMATSRNTNSEGEGDMSSATCASASRLPLKRSIDNSFTHDSDDEIGCSSLEALPNDESSFMSMFRPLKQPRINHRETAQWNNINSTNPN